MGAFLLAAGAKGKRFALPNSTVMIHQPSGGFQGAVSDIERHAQFVIDLKQRLPLADERPFGIILTHQIPGYLRLDRRIDHAVERADPLPLNWEIALLDDGYFDVRRRRCSGYGRASGTTTDDETANHDHESPAESEHPAIAFRFHFSPPFGAAPSPQ